MAMQDDELDLYKQASLPPDLMAAQQQLNNQQRMAQMLMQQNQQPQGQMISGRYVAPAWTQMLQPVANMLAGAYLSKQGDEKATALAKQIRDLSAIESANILAKKEGTPAMPAIEGGIYGANGLPTKETTADMFNADMSLAPQYKKVAPVAARPAVEGSNEAAYLEALKGYTPASKEMAAVLRKQLLQQPNWKETEINVNGTKVKGLYDSNKGEVSASNFRPFSSEANVPLREAIYKGVISPSEAGGTQVPLSVRNNNPGNLVAPNGQFQQFPTSEAGNTALINDLTLKVSGQSPAYKARFGDAPVTPARLAEVWSPASAQGNSSESTKNYGNYIAQKLGIDANSPIPNNPQAVGKLAEGITEFEKGAYGGKGVPAAAKYELQVPTNFTSQMERDKWLTDSRQPLTGEAKTKADGAIMTLTALDNYQGLVDKYSKLQYLSPDDRAVLNQAHAQLMLQLKDANGLGVLNKGDLPMLEKLIVNPNNMQSLLLSKKVLQDQVTGQKAYMRDFVANAYLDNGKQIPQRVKDKLMKVDKEFEQAETNKATEIKQRQLSQPMMFNTEDAVNAAAKAGKLEDGQQVIVNGRRATWRN
jgi:hypothetical protein